MVTQTWELGLTRGMATLGCCPWNHISYGLPSAYNLGNRGTRRARGTHDHDLGRLSGDRHRRRRSDRGRCQGRLARLHSCGGGCYQSPYNNPGFGCGSGSSSLSRSQGSYPHSLRSNHSQSSSRRTRSNVDKGQSRASNGSGCLMRPITLCLGNGSDSVDLCCCSRDSCR